MEFSAEHVIGGVGVFAALLDIEFTEPLDLLTAPLDTRSLLSSRGVRFRGLVLGGDDWRLRGRPLS